MTTTKLPTERQQVFREIAEALAHGDISGSCHGCANVGDDALLWLKRRFPDDLPYVHDTDPNSPYDKVVKLDDRDETADQLDRGGRPE